MQRLGRGVWPSAGVAALCALVVNLWQLEAAAPWRDEAATWLANQRSLPELFAMLGHVDAVHGLYYLLIRSWQVLAGDSVLSLRLASTLAVAITAGLLVVLGTAMFNLGVGRWAGLAYGLLPQVTWAAGEARSYALTAAAVTAAFLALWLAIRHESWGRWLAYAAAAAVSVHLFLFAALAFLAVPALLPLLARRTRLRAALATAAAALASVPFALVTTSQAGQVGWLADSAVTLDRVLLQTIWGGREWPAWIGVALLGTALAVAARSLRDPAHRMPLLAVLGWLVLPIAVLAAVHPFHAVFHPRYVTFTAPALALLLGWMLHRTRPWWLRSVIAALVLLACLPPLAQSRTADGKGVSALAGATRLAAESRAGDRLLVVGKDENALAWAFPELAGLKPVGTAEDPAWRRSRLAPTAVVPAGSSRQWDGARRVWLFAGRSAVGPELDSARRAMQRLGFSVRAKIRVDARYPVTLVLLEREARPIVAAGLIRR